MSTVRIILLIFGLLFLLASLPLTIGGGSILWANAFLPDDDGFFISGDHRLDRNSYAMVTESADIDFDEEWQGGWGWCGDWDSGDFVTIKIEGKNNDSSKGIFIGIAEESDWEEYLNDVEYDEVTDISLDPFTVDYINHPGNSSPEAPTSQSFWTESIYGTGRQVLEWEPETGTYSVILMNEDGSRSVDVDVAVGAKVPWLFGVGVGMVVGGVVALIIGILMVVFSLHGRKKSQLSEPTQPMHVIEEV
jgi:hypothetical protein